MLWTWESLQVLDKEEKDAVATLVACYPGMAPLELLLELQQQYRERRDRHIAQLEQVLQKECCMEMYQKCIEKWDYYTTPELTEDIIRQCITKEHIQALLQSKDRECDPVTLDMLHKRQGASNGELLAIIELEWVTPLRAVWKTAFPLAYIHMGGTKEWPKNLTMDNPTPETCKIADLAASATSSSAFQQELDTVIQAEMKMPLPTGAMQTYAALLHILESKPHKQTNTILKLRTILGDSLPLNIPRSVFVAKWVERFSAQIDQRSELREEHIEQLFEDWSRLPNCTQNDPASIIAEVFKTAITKVLIRKPIITKLLTKLAPSKDKLHIKIIQECSKVEQLKEKREIATAAFLKK